MLPGAIELTLMPFGPSSVASDDAIASSPDFTILYGPMLRCENRTTIELIKTTFSILTNWRTSRKAVITFASKASRTASRSTFIRSLIGGMCSALYTSASVRPNSAMAASASRSPASGSVMSTGTGSARRPSSATSLAISSSRDAVRAASTTSAPSRALASASDRPTPGPAPSTTTTLPSSIISPASLRWLSQHAERAGGLPGRDTCCPLGRRDPLVVRQEFADIADRHDVHCRAVGRGQVPGEPLPAKLDVPAVVPGALQPVDHARIPLADHEPHHAVRVHPRLVRGEAGLVVHVVERDVPPAAELDALIGRHRTARGGHGDDHRLVVGELVVPGRGELGGQAARGKPRLGQRVDRFLQVEPLGEREKRAEPGQQDL